MVGGNIGAHGKDAGLIEGCPQLASATYDTCAVGHEAELTCPTKLGLSGIDLYTVGQHMRWC